LRRDQKLLINVRDKGYQIGHPRDHLGVAEGLQAQSRRRLVRAVKTLVHVALDQLTDAERAAIVREQVRVTMKLAVDKRLTAQQVLPDCKQAIAMPSGRELVRLLTKKIKG
jgi:hypothetical protein